MQTPLSTDELFHFTQFEHLIGIIENGFYPRYNFEFTKLSDKFPNGGVTGECIPMVCFCDLPLSQVSDHINKYGKCAIGLNKLWGEKYGINPILYVHENSLIGDAISYLGLGLAMYNGEMVSNGENMKAIHVRMFEMLRMISKGIGNIAYYVKAYEVLNDYEINLNGYIHKVKKGRFYDEREWRYVPDNNYKDFWLINAHVMLKEDQKEEANEKLKRFVLRFELTDIKYIICETQEEKEKFITAISEHFKVNKDAVLKTVTFKLVRELEI